MFKFIKKVKLNKAIEKANFFHDCPRAEQKIALVNHAFDNLTRKPQTPVQLFTNYEGNRKALIFAEINVMHWLVKNHLAKTKQVNEKTYYYI